MFELDKQQFGAFVADQRRQKQMTQKDLAQKLMISDKAVSKWERGLNMPDITLLAPLSHLRIFLAHRYRFFYKLIDLMGAHRFRLRNSPAFQQLSHAHIQRLSQRH